MAGGDTAKGFAIGFVVGAIIGLAIGFLYAPKSGEETRAMLKEKATGIAEKVKESVAEAKKKAQIKLEEMTG